MAKKFVVILRATRVGSKARGNIEGLAAHLARKHGGDPGFFTACDKDPELAEYTPEQRAGICARAHKIVVGIWPGEGRKPAAKKE